jgi:Flp pilus assembly protein TadD
MHKMAISISLITIMVTVLLPGLSTVAIADGFDWNSTSVVASATLGDVNEADSSTPATTQKKQGNGFVRALGAPFRALGRLFGGNKKNDNQARRISEKDEKKFESTKVTRIKDASIQPIEPKPVASNTSATAGASQFDAYLQKGRELLIAGNIDGAISELSTAGSLNPKSAEVNNLLGIAYESKGLRERALQSFEVAVHAEENNAEHLNNLGFLLFKSGDYERATKYLKKAAKLSPNDARIWNNLALAQAQRNKFDDAYESFVKAVGEFGAHVNIAAQLQSRGYAKDAIQHLELAQKIKPNSVDVMNKLVALYEMTGRPTDAEATRRQILALKTFADVNK